MVAIASWIIAEDPLVRIVPHAELLRAVPVFNGLVLGPLEGLILVSSPTATLAVRLQFAILFLAEVSARALANVLPTCARPSVVVPPAGAKFAFRKFGTWIRGTLLSCLSFLSSKLGRWTRKAVLSVLCVVS